MNRATGIGMIAILLWSSLAWLTAASGTMPPFQLAAITFSIGGVFGLVFAALSGRLGALRQPLPVWCLGVGGLFGYHALYFTALRNAPAAEAGLIAYLWPLLIVLLTALLPGERLSGRHIAGSALGLVGVATLIVGPKLSNGETLAIDPKFAFGFSLAFACAFVWSMYSVVSRQLKAVPTQAVAGFCLGTAALAFVCHILFEQTQWPTLPTQWMAIVGLGTGPIGMAFYAWDYGVKQGDIRLLGVASYAAPVLSTLLLVATGVTPANLSLAIACGCIIGAALVATQGSRPALPHSAKSLTASE